MINRLIHTSIAKIGVNNTCAAFAGAGIVTGLILYPTIVKMIELAGSLFQKIKRYFQEENFTNKVKYFFYHKCTPNNTNHDDKDFFRGEKITTVTKETVFIPKKEVEKDIEVKKTILNTPNPIQPATFNENPPPSYTSAEKNNPDGK